MASKDFGTFSKFWWGNMQRCCRIFVPTTETTTECSANRRDYKIVYVQANWDFEFLPPLFHIITSARKSFVTPNMGFVGSPMPLHTKNCKGLAGHVANLSQQTRSWTRIAPKPNRIAAKMQYRRLPKYLRCWYGYNTKSQAQNLLLNVLHFLSFKLITMHIFAGMPSEPDTFDFYMHTERILQEAVEEYYESLSYRYSAGTEVDVGRIAPKALPRPLPRRELRNMAKLVWKGRSRDSPSPNPIKGLTSFFVGLGFRAWVCQPFVSLGLGCQGLRCGGPKCQCMLFVDSVHENANPIATTAKLKKRDVIYDIG